MAITPRLRWSFSLRTLFVVVTVCAFAAPLIPKAFAAYQRWQSERAWAGVGGPGTFHKFRTDSRCEFDGGDTAREASPATQVDQP